MSDSSGNRISELFYIWYDSWNMKKNSTKTAYVLYTGESENENAMPDHATDRNSTVGIQKEVRGANSTLFEEGLYLDKLGFDDPLPVDEFFNTYRN